MKSFFGCDTTEFDDILDLRLVTCGLYLQELRKQEREIAQQKPETIQDAAKLMDTLGEIVQYSANVDEIRGLLKKLSLELGRNLPVEAENSLLKTLLRVVLTFSSFSMDALEDFIKQEVENEDQYLEWLKRSEENHYSIEAVLDDMVDMYEFHGSSSLVEKKQHVEQRVSEFIQTWRKRAAVFEVPVTIYGRAIFSIISPEIRDRWLAAYKEMDLSPGVGIYQHEFEPKPANGVV